MRRGQPTVAAKNRDPIHLHLWDHPEVRHLCATRDAPGLLRLITEADDIKHARIAYWMRVDPRQITRIINHEPTPTGQPPATTFQTWHRIADALNMPDTNRRLIGIAPRELASNPEKPQRTAVTPPDDQTAREDEPVNRRELLSAGGAVLAGTLLDLVLYEPGRMHTALDTGTVGQARLADLRYEADFLGVQVVRVSPGSLLSVAMTRFHEVRELLGTKQTLATQRELTQLGAMFGTVAGEILFNHGQFPLARQWYGAANRAAMEAGDRYLADIALAGSAYLPTYSADPRSVLQLVGPRLASNPSPSPAIAWLWGFKAKAHAVLGERIAFQEAVDHSHAALDGSAPDLIRPGIFSFVPEKLSFYEARGWVELGDVEAASVASERALAQYDLSENTEPALVRFERASALVQATEVEEACRVATDAVLDPHTYRSITVVTRAREFDQLLNGTPDDGPVGEWREVLRTLRPPRPVLALPADTAS